MRKQAGDFLQAGEFIRSVEQRVFTSHAKKIRLLRRRADGARDAKDVRNAALLYEALLNYDPDNAAIHIQCGHMHKEVGDLARAEMHYLRARTMMPDDADLNLQFGHFYKVAGRLYEARAAYQRAADLVPDWVEPQNELQALRPLLQEQMTADGLIDVADAPRTAPTQQGQYDALPHNGPAVEKPLPDLRVTAKQIVESGLFDKSWYQKEYGDVKGAGLDPLAHFMSDGMAEGRAPGPGFLPALYRESYSEVDQSGLDPFSHYILIGRYKQLNPRGLGRYVRWVLKFDTLSDQDRTEIRQHISDDEIQAPVVVMIVDAIHADGLFKTIQSLRLQVLMPAQVMLCLTPDCSPRTRRSALSLVGSDPLYEIVDAANIELIAARTHKPAYLHRVEPPILLLDVSVELREHALYMFVHACGPQTRLVYSDEDQVDADGMRHDPKFKPDASPELLRQSHYLGACVLLNGSSTNIDELVREAVAGRVTVASEAQKAFFSAEHAVVHVPFVLFHAHAPQRVPQSMQQLALNDATLPTVSVIVPTRDKVELLRTCVESLWAETSYPLDKLEVIVVDNGSTQWETLDYMEAAASDGKLRVITDPRPFNYARLNNLAARTSTSDLLILLNNDTEIQDPTWLRCLADYAMRPDIGAVGPKLLYADGTIQHGGIVLNVGGVAAHAHLGLGYEEPGVMGLAQVTHEVAAVTGACLAIRRQVFEEIGGLDEALPVAFNDVLLCLNCLDHGYRNIYLPHAWLRHHESKSRGVDDTPAKVEVYLREARYTRRRFPLLFKSDTYYNPNLDLNLEYLYEAAFPPRCTYPWRTHARAKLPKRLLVLSNEFTDTNNVGVAALAQARYFMDSGYEVLVGSPALQHNPYLDGARYVRLEDSTAAALCVTTLQVDAVIVNSPPYLSIARLLGNRPITVLFYNESDASGLGAEHRSATMLDYSLNGPSFDLVATSSQLLAERFGRDDVMICPAGGDLLGTWNSTLLPRRNQARKARQWNKQFVILTKLDPFAATSEMTQLSNLQSLAEHLDHNQVIIAVMGRDLPSHAGLLVLIDPRPVGSSLVDLYVAADLFLDMTFPESGSLEATEAKAFGLPLVCMDTAKAGSVDGTVRESAIFEMVQRLTRQMTLLPRDRQPTGLTWTESFSILDSRIASLLGRSTTITAEYPTSLLSDRALITWSGLFDADYYSKRYPEVASSGQDPLAHFCEHGGREFRQPSELFWSHWYANSYPEVARSGTNLLVHYLRHPNDAYDPNPFFSNVAYIADWTDRSQDPAKAVLPPFLHYIWHGAAEGRLPGPNFDPRFYQETYLNVPVDVNPLVHFLHYGVPEGRMAVRPKLFKMDVYDVRDMARAINQPEANLSWRPVKAASVSDKRTAIRFCIDLLTASPILRARHPQALSGGVSGSFFNWLVGDGAAELELSEAAVTHIRALFEEDFAAPLVQAYLTRADLRTTHPFALLPLGIGGFVGWLITSGKQELGTSIEQIRWFAITRAEDPGAEVVRTYKFSPAMQREFPDGITIFGRRGLAAWLRQFVSDDEPWTIAASWPSTLTAAEQIRLAYAASKTWQQAHPAPFTSRAAAMALVTWLKSPSAKIDPDALTWLSGLDSEEVVSDLVVDGVNMIGHFCYVSGLRTSTISLLEGYRSVGYNSTRRDMWVETVEAEPHHADYGGLEVYDTTIIHTQPEPFFYGAYPRAGLAPRDPRTYRIGYWYWELDTVPQAWLGQASQLDEIWTATRFVGDALRSRLKLPVYEIMPGFELPSFTPLSRDYFGLPKTEYLFLFTFHMMSIMERKNPLGLITAFKHAFATDTSVGLVLKTSFGDKHPELMKQMREAARGSNIMIIDAIYTQKEIMALMQTCDAYVSLHRSEGYGLTMLEAMLLGKPVIATGYSGNLDFMTQETGLLVDYDLVKLERAIGPYEIGTQWAEPSIGHAAECMQKVRANPDWSHAMGQRAKADLETLLSYKSAGQRMAARLAEINETRITK